MNINAIIAQLELQTDWFLHALDNISDDESNRLFSENQNPVKWVAGHVTDARMTIFSIVSDSTFNTKYKALFGKGTSYHLDAAFPTIEEISAEWATVSILLIPSVQSLPEEKLWSKPPFQTSIPDETLAGLIAYFVIHESFHIGQLSIYRKLLQKPAMLTGRR